MMYCSKCGEKVLEGAAFCGKCGVSLKDYPPVQEQEYFETEENVTQETPAAVEEVKTENTSSQMYAAPVQPREEQRSQAYEQARPVYGAGTQAYRQPAIPIRNYDPSKDYTPIGMWGYFGYQLLFAIPIVGFILILVFSFGGTRNINLRNYARSTFCWLIIVVVVLLAILLIGAIAAVASAAH